MRVCILLIISGLVAGCNSSPQPKVAPVGPENPTSPRDAVSDARLAAAKTKPVQPVHLELKKPLQLEGEMAGNVELTSYTTEEIAASPDGKMPSGSGAVMAVLIAGSTVELSDLSAGYESQRVAWTTDYKVTLLGFDDGAGSVDVLIERITDKTTAQVHSRATVRRGETLALGNDVRMIFESHGHRTVPIGKESPLSVSLSYRKGRQQLNKASHNLYPPEKSRWRFRDYEFHLVSHEYDQHMILDVNRLALEAVSAVTP